MSTQQHSRLAAHHFKPRQRASFGDRPAAKKLGSGIAEALTSVLQGLGGAPWRVALDRVEDADVVADGEFAKPLRLESKAGSLTLRLVIDRPAISGLIEVAMGGMGAEQPFELGERPFSAIETEVVRLACSRLGEGMALALTTQLEIPFGVFDGLVDEDMDRYQGDLVTFRFLANIFGYSGEIRLTAICSELVRQLGVLDTEGSSTDTTDGQQSDFHREIGKSEVQLMVTLGHETLRVEEIANLVPGSLLRLSSTITAPVTVWSGDNPVYQASLARAGDQLAVSILAPVA